MKKSKWNLIIDAVLLLCTAAIVGIGLLMKYVLIAGYQRWEVYNSNVELYFWGMDRHQWGTIHLIIGLVFLGLLVLHIILHWSMIVGIYKCLIPNRLLRYIVMVILIAVTVILLVFSWFVSPEQIERGGGRGSYWHQSGE